MPTLDTIVALVEHYRYFMLFPVAVLEGPIITVIAGFLAAQGLFDKSALYLVLVSADLTGDLLYYGIGRWGSRFGFTKNGTRREALKEYFEKNGGKALMLGKITHSAGFVVLMGAGAAEMPLREYLWYNLLGTLPKSLFFLLIGIFFGAAYNQIDRALQIATLVLFVILCAVAFLLKKKYEKDFLSRAGL